LRSPHELHSSQTYSRMSSLLPRGAGG
jgi:hypothetical protein